MKAVIGKFIAVAIVLTGIMSSCKKDEETTTLPSLDGITVNDALAYVPVNSKCDFTIDLSSLYSSDLSTFSKVGVYVQFDSEKKDTLTKDLGAVKTLPCSFTPTSTGDHTLYAAAYCDGYYSATITVPFVAVDPETALTGISGAAGAGEKYRVITLGSLDWTAENIYEAGGILYENCPVTETLFGRYYTYEEALTACPAGWRLPTEAEWDALGTASEPLMANAFFMGTRLWKRDASINPSNTTGFNAIPVGYTDKSKDKAGNTGLKEYAAFWTADSNADLARYVYLFNGSARVQKNEGSKSSLALSVRCVR